MQINRPTAGALALLPVALNKGGDTKIELGFSMTLAGAIPGIHPEGRRLGALRLGRRLETPKSQVWFLPTMGYHR
jgi:hypothetical protein